MSAAIGDNHREQMSESVAVAPALRSMALAGAAPEVLADPSALPAAPGAYLLVVALDRPLSLDVPRPCALEPGTYLYFGSARGPGGIGARTRRHLRATRRPHWHVDRLTAAGATRAVLVWPGGGECGWRAAVQERGASVPLSGFGSSDCRHCPAHLLRLDGADADDPRLRPPFAEGGPDGRVDGRER